METPQPIYKKSSITGRTYDLFGIVRILNLYQIQFYLERHVPVQDIEMGSDKKTGKPVVIFYFNKADTYDAYNEWCNRGNI